MTDKEQAVVEAALDIDWRDVDEVLSPISRIRAETLIAAIAELRAKQGGEGES